VASFGSMDGFTLSGFNDLVYKTAIDSLNQARQIYMRRRNRASTLKERHASGLVEKWGGKEAYNQIKRSYSNRKLEDLLLNRGRFVIECNKHLVRKIAPVYQVPRSRIARAHMFAPVKRVGSFSFDTYWFNLVVLWLSTIVFYFALLYDLLRRIANWNQIRKLRKSR
jgi:hypothetical protein